MLDLGQYYELEKLDNNEILNKLQNKFDIINLNERVEKYLINRFNLTNSKDIFDQIKPNLIIITRGKDDSDFICQDFKITMMLTNPAEEIDSTGAGDAFFAVFISEYIKNNFIINKKFIEETFKKATNLTKKVVQKFGARGHINSLYKIKKLNNYCTCQNFEIKTPRKNKTCNININNLETRVINALNSNAYHKLEKINFNEIKNSLFIGTGGSLAGTTFASKVINNLYGTNIISSLPRDVYYRNNKQIDKVFLFSYSGTTSDLLTGTANIDNSKKYIITKGPIKKINTTMNIPKTNIITYRTNNNKSRERGFLSFEGVLSPASLFLKLYLKQTTKDDEIKFIKNRFKYWKEHFKTYFKDNKQELQNFFTKENIFSIFTGDYTEAASTDLESKITESGIFNCILHEKKNFSHGRFINYEYLSKKKNIYFKQKTTGPYEEGLLNYLKDGDNLIIESNYDGILCEYDLLIATQYLIYYIAKLLDIDISKPAYSEEAMKIYFYKGNL